MRKNSNSLRTSLSQMSFFDIPSPSENFWKNSFAKEDSSNLTKVIESEFKIRAKGFFKDWDSCILTLQDRFLIYKKVILLFLFIPKVFKENSKE